MPLLSLIHCENSNESTVLVLLLTGNYNKLYHVITEHISSNNDGLLGH